MLFHYRNPSTGAIVTSKIVIPPRLFYNAHDGIVGCSGPLFSVDQSSTSIFKLYPTFQVPTVVSEGYNIVNFKCNAISRHFFYPPEYVHDMVDFVIGPSQGQTLSGSLNTLGLLTHNSLSQYTPEEKEEMKGPPPPVFDKPTVIPQIVAHLDAVAADADATAARVDAKGEEAMWGEKKPASPMSFFKSIWRKFLDILPISTIGFERRSETNFFDTDPHADFNKMFIRFTLEICDELERYVGTTTIYEFATHHALATAKDLFQVCSIDYVVLEKGSPEDRNNALAGNVVANVDKFIKTHSDISQKILYRLAIYTAIAIAYIYSNKDKKINDKHIKLLELEINKPTVDEILTLITDPSYKIGMLKSIHAFLLRDDLPEKKQGGGRRRTRRTLRRVSRKLYKKILTCPRRSRRRGSHRRRSRRRSRRSYKIVAK